MTKTKLAIRARKGNIIDITGERFEFLVVLELDSSKPTGNGRSAYWLCQCDCGLIKSICGQRLRTGETKSCGCQKSKLLSITNTKHGRSFTPEYRTWAYIKNRCNNPKHKFYDRYGGRGIKVSKEWSSSFETFLADMGQKPSPTHEIDRIDNNGNYEKGNCKWATSSEQKLNTSRTVFIEINNEKVPLRSIAKSLNLNPIVIYQRIAVRKWPVDRALSTPIHKYCRQKEKNRKCK